MKYRKEVRQELAHWQPDVRRNGAVIRAIELGVKLGLEAAANHIQDSTNDNGDSVREISVFDVLRAERERTAVTPTLDAALDDATTRDKENS